MADTSIEWATKVWNPTTGCDRVSPGCDHCYALTMANRLKGMGSAKYQRDGDPRTSGPGFGLSVHPDTLNLPLKWRKPERIFVNSMSDLFHDQVPDDYIARVFAVMATTRRHTYQILTKRHGRMRSLLNDSEFYPAVRNAIIRGWSVEAAQQVQAQQGWPFPNVWLGVSAENQQWADIRIPALLDTPAAVRFVSAEPLLGPIQLFSDSEYFAPGPGRRDSGYSLMDWPSGKHTPLYRQVDWVITGGESGPGARPAHPDWFRSIRDQCQNAGVAYLHKQWGEWAPGRITSHPQFGGGAYFDDGGRCVGGNFAVSLSSVHDFGDGVGAYRIGKKRAGRELDGRTWDEYPQAVTHG